jgi:hypothetical protein
MILKFENKRLDALAIRIETITLEMLDIQQQLESMPLSEIDQKTFNMYITESLMEFIDFDYIEEMSNIDDRKI